ncbi:MAG: SDR family NAD(P)-dependent oxidoreductase [Kiritimatiellae bacterium]|nr:SDR family NAD(P)-dependent oxidoreductase [Kiritimatiellia bacterium]
MAAASALPSILADVAALGTAYLFSFFLRFDFAEPTWGWMRVAQSFGTVCIVHVSMLAAFGCYGRRTRVFGWCDLPRFGFAMAAACAALTAMRYLLPNVAFAHIRPPYSITLLSFLIGTANIVAWRVARRFYLQASRQGSLFPMERDEKTFDNTVAARFLAGRTVMVTGAGGTIGSELVRQAAAAGASRILMVERCENALYEIDRRMKREAYAAAIVPVMLDVGDRERMGALFRREKPSVVLHAAACKHVPMVELNPEEGWRNNTEATKTLAELSSANGVERFVLISTDKAVNPVSVMGKTKRAAEQAVMETGGGCSFCAVRFGNVFGSSGSVVPLFREQIAAGGPVTVTHPDMKRYFMTVREAVSLVLQAASRKEKAVYTLDMGEPVGIVALAERMIRQAGLRPYADIPIVFTGARPGEKLFEEIDVSEKSAYKTDMAKIYITRV